MLPFAMTGSRELLEALPRHQTAHAALLTDILESCRGASPAAGDQAPYPDKSSARANCGCCATCRPTCPGRRSPSELTVFVNTVSTHIRSIYAKLGAEDRSAAVHRARELRLLSVASMVASAPTGQAPG